MIQNGYLREGKDSLVKSKYENVLVEENPAKALGTHNSIIELLKIVAIVRQCVHRPCYFYSRVTKSEEVRETVSLE